MNSSATIYGSFSRPGPQSSAAAPSNSAGDSVFDSFADYPAALPQQHPGRIETALGAWLARVQLAFDRWCESNAQARADARVWDIARSDPRIMADLMHARMRDERDTESEPMAASMPAAAPVEAMPVAQPQRPSVASQGWGRMIQDAYQNRSHQPRPQHA